jgi:hypothetical protein
MQRKTSKQTHSKAFQSKHDGRAGRSHRETDWDSDGNALLSN